MTSQDHIDFFWRPGCGFCMSLERRLKNAGVTFKKHNIWENKRDRAFVKSVAHGNETVPTLRIGSKSLVNPKPESGLTGHEVRSPSPGAS